MSDNTNASTIRTAPRTIGNVSIPVDVKQVTVIAGGDPDGALWAGLTEQLLGAMGITVVKRFERWLPLKDFPGGAVILGDLPLSNQDLAGALAQLRERKEQILMAVGHHVGDNAYVEVLGERAWVREKAPSCPSVMMEHAVEVPAWVINASNFLDSPRGGFTETAIAKMIRWAFDYALVELGAGNRGAIDSIVEAISALAGDDSSAFAFIWRRAALYEPVFQSLTGAIERAQPIGRSVLSGGHKVGYVSLSDGEPAPLTTLFGLLYEQGYKVVVIQSWSQGTPLTTIALDRGVQLDLVQAFGLETGSASRVVLPGIVHKDALTKVLDTLQIVAEEQTETQS